MLISSLAAVTALNAQETLPQDATPKPALPQPQKSQTPQTLPSPPAPPQQSSAQQPGATPEAAPGAGAQVRTGSQFGQEQSTFSRLFSLLRDHQFPDMEQMLDAPESNDDAVLPPKQKQLLRGVLANHENKPLESIQMLEPLLDSLVSSGDAAQEKIVRKALAEDYLRTGQWAKASQAYQNYDSRMGASLTADERDEIELPLKLLPLAIGHPAMTVEPGDAFSLPYDRDAIGLTDIPVFVDAQSHDWMLDPTAPFNLICRSTAREVGLKISEQSATVHTITGRAMVVHATVIPRFTLGTVTFRNMTAFVFDDADYAFPQSHYEVRGVLGYPAISALGSLKITADAKIEVQPGEKGERLTSGARFFLDGDQILAALGKPGEERMYAIDASGQQTYLTSRYYAEHEDEFADKKMQLLSMPGSQHKPPAPAYVSESVRLLVGETPASFHFMQVLTEPLGSSAVDDTYGTLGMDALDELKSYTFDYRTMHFGVTTEETGRTRY
ncbi:retropepsin-like aspartic protease [Acidicapsa ligni]|uniref:retropepsin-like aspartic protease n=1 Tax=Acidicapsa ligni TaxID=542300 RepID=UPI0021E0CA52|nr:retropepsin-like aspartic protease [Acidicapsa ligni]